jgi:hypothetical protein
VEIDNLLWTPAVCTKAIPILLPTTVNDRAGCSYDQNMIAGNLDWFELRAVGEVKTGSTFEGD